MILNIVSNLREYEEWQTVEIILRIILFRIVESDSITIKSN